MTRQRYTKISKYPQHRPAFLYLLAKKVRAGVSCFSIWGAALPRAEASGGQPIRTDKDKCQDRKYFHM